MSRCRRWPPRSRTRSASSRGRSSSPCRSSSLPTPSRPWPASGRPAPATGSNMASDASGSAQLVDFVKAASIVGGGFLMWLMLASAIASNLGLYTGYLATGSRPSYQLSRDRLLPEVHGSRAQALGHALDRHPHHGRGRRHPRQGQLHHADRDRRVPAHVQLHPDLHRGDRAAGARAEPAAALPHADPHVAARRVGVLRRSPSPSTRSSPTAATTWSAAWSAWSAARSPTCS